MLHLFENLNRQSINRGCNSSFFVCSKARVLSLIPNCVSLSNYLTNDISHTWLSSNFICTCVYFLKILDWLIDNICWPLAFQNITIIRIPPVYSTYRTVFFFVPDTCRSKCQTKQHICKGAETRLTHQGFWEGKKPSTTAVNEWSSWQETHIRR